jgi:hypothetical protein
LALTPVLTLSLVTAPMLVLHLLTLPSTFSRT